MSSFAAVAKSLPTLLHRIRVNIIGLSAEMKICKEICTKTKGPALPLPRSRPLLTHQPTGTFSVAKDDLYLRELLFEFVSPPPTIAPSKSNVLGGPSSTAPTNTADLMLMGFPTLVHAPYPGLCSCHSKLKSIGFTCPRCKSRICDVPTECKVCGLTVVSSPHLARSYRHLFPVRLLPSPPASLTLSQVANYEQVNGSVPPFPPSSSLTPHSPSPPPLQSACHSCAFPFAELAIQAPDPTGSVALSALSPTGRYACRECRRHFCLECDVLVHTALGFCPGCV